MASSLDAEAGRRHREKTHVSRSATKAKRGNFAVRFLRETRSELRKVVWPTRREALNMTAIVLGVTLLMAAGLGLVDWLLTKLFALVVR